MKQPIFVCLLGAIAFSYAASAGVSNDFTLATTATLRDGSTLKGTLLTDTVTGAAIFDSALKLKAEVIQSLFFTDTNGTAKASLVNGDVLTLAVTTPAFDMNTSLGKLSLVRSNVKSLSLAKRKSAVADNASIVFHCTFDDAASITSPAVGQTGKINNAKFQDGKVNNALLVTRGLSACEFPLPVGTLSDKGCIEFWAKFMDGKTEFTTGGDPRFFTIYDPKGNTRGLLEYASNNGAGRSGISGVFGDVVTSHNGFSHMMPYSSIFKGAPYENWHHYALVWNKSGISKFGHATGTPRLVILLDGKKIDETYNRASSDKFFADLNTSELNMGIPMNFTGPSFNNKSCFLIDELKIWNFDKTEFDELQ